MVAILRRYRVCGRPRSLFGTGAVYDTFVELAKRIFQLGAHRRKPSSANGLTNGADGLFTVSRWDFHTLYSTPHPHVMKLLYCNPPPPSLLSSSNPNSAIHISTLRLPFWLLETSSFHLVHLTDCRCCYCGNSNDVPQNQNATPELQKRRETRTTATIQLAARLN